MTGHVTKIGYFGRFKTHDKIIKHKLFPKKKKKIGRPASPEQKFRNPVFFQARFGCLNVREFAKIH